MLKAEVGTEGGKGRVDSDIGDRKMPARGGNPEMCPGGRRGDLA